MKKLSKINHFIYLCTFILFFYKDLLLRTNFSILNNKKFKIIFILGRLKRKFQLLIISINKSFKDYIKKILINII